MTIERTIQSLRLALAPYGVSIIEYHRNKHIRICAVTATAQRFHITLSHSPSDSHAQNMRERCIRRQLVQLGVPNATSFSWRTI